MTRVNRRNFIKLIGASAAVAGAPAVVKTASAAGALKVVVVGGGFGGASAAKYLKHWGGDQLDVTLIDKNAFHYSCVLSNLVVNGRLGMNDIKLTYDTLKTKYGVRVVRGEVAASDIDLNALEVTNLDTRLRELLEFDHLILSPGIDFEAIPFAAGTSEARKKLVLHAWQAGQQTLDLKNQLNRMPNGGVYLLAIPPKPYRCPPGPYERACVVADYFTRLKPASKVIVLDANASIVAEPNTFGKAFTDLYGSILEYHPSATVDEVSFKTVSGVLKRVVKATVGGVATEYTCDVLNILPKMKAAAIVRDAFGGDLLRDANGQDPATPVLWAQVDPFSYGSVNPAYAHIHVVGDSSGGAAATSNQPKSAHMANAQAKICADAIVRIANGQAVDDPARIGNIVTNSACYSPITYDEASWLTAVFRYDETDGVMKIADYQSTGTSDAASGEAEAWDGENFEAMLKKWSVNLFADCFS